MSIPGSVTPLFNTGSSVAGYQISRSLRFNSSDSAYLSRTPAVAGNRRTWTWAGWVKRSAISYSAQQHIWGVTGTTDGTYGEMFFDTGDTLRFAVGYNTAYGITTTRVFRDPGAWFHLLVAFDATQSTAANKIKLYINGTEETAFSSDTRSSLANQDWGYNNTVAHYIGRLANSDIRHFNGYLAEVYFIDGQALTPSSFTEVSATTGQLIPKTYSGTYGTNGFWLKFSDNSAATAATLGKDYSGNSNNWTPNNLSVTAGSGNDSLVDTPTSYGTDTGAGGEVRGNYCTWNPLSNNVGTLSNGNLQLGAIGSPYTRCNSTFAMSSGKWYFETTLTTASSDTAIGIGQGDITTQYPGQDGVSYAFVCEAGVKINSNNQVSYGVSLTTGDVLMVAFDLDNSKIFFGKNGTWMASSNPVTGANPAFTLTTGEYKPITRPYSSSAVINANFGQRAFAYTAPSGFKALCDTNLGTPVVAKPSTVMDVLTWSGNNVSPRTFSGLNFSPDFVWIKCRSDAAGHSLYDTVRDVGKLLESNITAAEVTNSQFGYLSAFNSDGFTALTGTYPGYEFGSVNMTGRTYVAWAWDAGTSTVSNTSGSITSSVRANASAGFSIVTYTGNATNGATVGHGLGVAPAFFVIKKRSATSNWTTYHKSLGAGGSVFLNLTEPYSSDPTRFNNTAPSSTVVTLGAPFEGNTSGATYVMYCFSSVVGYSSFGSYTGNGSADGPFVFTGFRPRWIMVKCTQDIAGDVEQWVIKDTTRSTYNEVFDNLYANLSNAEDDVSGTAIDVLSNGFKLRGTYGGINGSATYIYAAFAENPFQYARAR